MTKTTRVMLAVLAVCGTSAAMAQSSVTLYGRVNTSIESQQLKKAGEVKRSASGMVSNGSFIGFKGVEDLGNGLKAGFVLESNFNADNGSGTASGLDFTRNSEVNLAGNFGMLRLGTFDPASYLATADYISMHNHDTGTSADALYSFNGRTQNKIAYRTPEFAGFTGEIQYSFGEKSGFGTRGDEVRGAVDLGINYANGPLGLGFGYSNENSKATGGIGAQKSKDQYAIRASYAVGSLTLGAYYQRAEEEVAGSTSSKRNIYRLAAMYTMGASEFHANVGRASKLKTRTGAVANSAATQWTLAYNYNLSKRTKVYALYSSINNGVNSDFGTDRFFNATGTTSGADFRTFGIGVRHLF